MCTLLNSFSIGAGADSTEEDVGTIVQLYKERRMKVCKSLYMLSIIFTSKLQYFFKKNSDVSLTH